jgi:hypothetical protein
VNAVGWEVLLGRILIVGVNHQIQPAEILSWGSNGKPQKFEKEQKEQFASLLEGKIIENDVQVVFEEAMHGQETVTQRVCESANCRRVNIEMTPEERSARAIPAGYNENPEFPATDRERSNREREDYMAAKTITEPGEAESVIVICGSRHVQPLAERFRDAGHTVECIELEDQPWYIEDWAEHMRTKL